MSIEKLLLSLSGAFAIVLLSSGCTSRDEPTTAADMAAIDAIWSRYASTLEAGDIDAWLSLWTDDGIQMPPGEPAMIGLDQIRARNGAALDLFSVEMDISNEEVQVVDDWAYSRGTYTATFTPKNGDEPMLVDGKFMTIHVRQPDGEWKIHRDIFNSNVPPGGG